MYLKLQRQPPDGETLRGCLYIDGQKYCSTLERTSKAIPASDFPIIVTMSPKFKRLLPLVCNVPNRSGIRIHVGAKAEYSLGCVLVPNRQIEYELTQLLLAAQKGNETITLSISYGA